jgi:EAL domain-containing protein (putative c-di-GMP-specific phosphodiesterase class I)
MDDGSARILAGANADRRPEGSGARSRAPVSFVVEEDGSIRRFLSLILHGAGVDAEEFADVASLTQAIARPYPELVVLNIGAESSEAIEALRVLAQRGYSGFVQLMSARGSTVLRHVKGVGEEHGLRMLPVMRKPFEPSAVVKVVQRLALGHPASTDARIEFREALENNWIEFWYQPKIDLRKKLLAGAEAFARARHPQFGILLPAAFMPGATEAELIALAELALVNALRAATNISKLGINLRLAVNISLDALVKLPIADIVRAHRPRNEGWAGLVIDVTEEQVVTDLALAADMARQLAKVGVRLAIDDFGRGYSSFARLKELPFSELKLDRTFVRHCGTDRINGPICKTVIDLAHNFSSAAVAVGIERAPDALALTRMGCDIGQGSLLGQPMPEERLLSLLRQRAAGQSAHAAAR